MDSRKRGASSLSSKLVEYPTKKDMSQRLSLPACPPRCTKTQIKRTSQKSLFPEILTPKAVFFTKPVSLSKLYNSDRQQSYFEQVFAKYSKVGEGSFGEVFRTYSREDGNIYAVKQLKTVHHYKYGYAEVENYEKIGDHDNFVKFHMAWEELKIIHIQMEYCQLSLLEYSQKTGRIDEAQLWEILHDMLKALQHLHKKNLIHLDVKPGNIMISWGNFKLADFGLLVDLNKHDGKKLSTISDGDAKYLASEVLDGTYTFACDIFGLGISLLELATNIELPEFGPLWHQIRKDSLPSSFYDTASPEFSATIKKMMAVGHWERPTAERLLKCPNLRMVSRRDKKFPRHNCCANLIEEYPMLWSEPPIVTINNNNIFDTPRRPLHEVRKTWSNSGSIEIGKVAKSASPQAHRDTPPISTTKKGLFRVKLDFN